MTAELQALMCRLALRLEALLTLTVQVLMHRKNVVQLAPVHRLHESGA